MFLMGFMWMKFSSALKKRLCGVDLVQTAGMKRNDTSLNLLRPV